MRIQPNYRLPGRGIIVLFFSLTLLGCERDDRIVTYRAPKDVPSTAAAAMQPMNEPAAPDAPAAAAPEQPAVVQWSVPSGWKSLPAGQMRYAVFQVSPDDPTLALTVIPLGLEAAGVAPNVNRWEGQLGLPPTPEADLPKIVKHIEANGVEIDTVDLIGPESANPRMRMLGAMITRPDKVWFFKLLGPADKIAAHQAEFDAFMKSIKFAVGDPHVHGAAAGEVALPPGHPAPAVPLPAGHPDPTGTLPPGHPTPGATLPPGHPDPAATLPPGHVAIPPSTSPAMPNMPAMPGMGGAPTDPAGMKWTLPQGWTARPDKPMRVATFGTEGGAEVIVSRFGAGAFGGMLANINRWRGMVGLPPVVDVADQPSEKITVGGEKSDLYEFTGVAQGPGPAVKLIVVSIPHADQVYFIRFVGPGTEIATQKKSFEAFLKSIQW